MKASGEAFSDFDQMAENMNITAQLFGDGFNDGLKNLHEIRMMYERGNILGIQEHLSEQLAQTLEYREKDGKMILWSKKNNDILYQSQIKQAAKMMGMDNVSALRSIKAAEMMEMMNTKGFKIEKDMLKTAESKELFAASEYDYSMAMFSALRDAGKDEEFILKKLSQEGKTIEQITRDRKELVSIAEDEMINRAKIIEDQKGMEEKTIATMTALQTTMANVNKNLQTLVDKGGEKLRKATEEILTTIEKVSIGTFDGLTTGLEMWNEKNTLKENITQILEGGVKGGIIAGSENITAADLKGKGIFKAIEMAMVDAMGGDFEEQGLGDILTEKIKSAWDYGIDKMQQLWHEAGALFGDLWVELENIFDKVSVDLLSAADDFWGGINEDDEAQRRADLQARTDKRNALRDQERAQTQAQRLEDAAAKRVERLDPGAMRGRESAETDAAFDKRTADWVKLQKNYEVQVAEIEADLAENIEPVNKSLEILNKAVNKATEVHNQVADRVAIANMDTAMSGGVTGPDFLAFGFAEQSRDMAMAVTEIIDRRTGVETLPQNDFANVAAFQDKAKLIQSMLKLADSNDAVTLSVEDIISGFSELKKEGFTEYDKTTDKFILAQLEAGESFTQAVSLLTESKAQVDLMKEIQDLQGSMEFGPDMTWDGILGIGEEETLAQIKNIEEELGLYQLSATEQAAKIEEIKRKQLEVTKDLNAIQGDTVKNTEQKNNLLLQQIELAAKLETIEDGSEKEELVKQQKSLADQLKIVQKEIEQENILLERQIELIKQLKEMQLIDIFEAMQSPDAGLAQRWADIFETNQTPLKQSQIPDTEKVAVGATSQTVEKVADATQDIARSATLSADVAKDMRDRIAYLQKALEDTFSFDFDEFGLIRMPEEVKAAEEEIASLQKELSLATIEPNRAQGWAGGAHRGIVGEAGTEVGITKSALRELASAGIPGYADGLVPTMNAAAAAPPTAADDAFAEMDQINKELEKRGMTNYSNIDVIDLKLPITEDSLKDVEVKLPKNTEVKLPKNTEVELPKNTEVELNQEGANLIENVIGVSQTAEELLEEGPGVVGVSPTVDELLKKGPGVVGVSQTAENILDEDINVSTKTANILGDGNGIAIETEAAEGWRQRFTSTLKDVGKGIIVSLGDVVLETSRQLHLIPEEIKKVSDTEKDAAAQISTADGDAAKNVAVSAELQEKINKDNQRVLEEMGESLHQQMKALGFSEARIQEIKQAAAQRFDEAQAATAAPAPDKKIPLIEEVAELKLNPEDINTIGRDKISINPEDMEIVQNGVKLKLDQESKETIENGVKLKLDQEFVEIIERDINIKVNPEDIAVIEKDININQEDIDAIAKDINVNPEDISAIAKGAEVSLQPDEKKTIETIADGITISVDPSQIPMNTTIDFNQEAKEALEKDLSIKINPEAQGVLEQGVKINLEDSPDDIMIIQKGAEVSFKPEQAKALDAMADGITVSIDPSQISIINKLVDAAAAVATPTVDAAKRAFGWASGLHKGIVGEAGTEVGITKSALRELASAGIPGYQWLWKIY